MSEPLLQVQDLAKKFGGVVALDRVSFSVDRGQIISVIGPNGAGKTTLFNCISGLTRPDSGQIHFGVGVASKNLIGLAPHEVARLGISRTFQNIRLFPGMTVRENVLAGMHVKTCSSWGTVLWPWSSRARQEDRWAADRAVLLLERIGLVDLADRPAGALSYGQQRRVELARALASEPDLLLLDEPAAGLNFEERQALMDFLRRLRNEARTLLLIEHDMRVVMPVSDGVLVLDDGAKIAEGPPRRIQEDRRVIEAYLGMESAVV